MPTTIPVIQDSAQLDTGTGRQRIQADASAFGGQEARAIGAVAEGLGDVAQVAAQKDDEFNEANARELDNELSARIRDRLHNPESGYLATQRGRNAIDNRAQVEAEVDEIAAEIGARARNPRAAAMYQGVARRRVESALGDIAGYAERETRNYQNEVSEAAITEAIDNAVAAYEDPAVVAQNRSTVLGELSRLRERNGWDDQVLNQRVRQFQSDVSSRIIVQMATTDPEAATSYFERVAPSLTADDRAQLGSTLRAAIRETEEAIIDDAWTHVSEGRMPPRDLWARVPGRARIDIQNEMRRRNEGGAGTGDRARYDELRVMLMDNPQGFARFDLQAERGRLGADNYLRLRQAQEELRAGREPVDANAQRTAYNAIVQTAQAALAPHGFDLAPDNEQGQVLRQALLSEVERHIAATGAAPTAEEAQILIGRAVISLRSRDAPRAAQVEGMPNRERAGRRGNSGVDVPSVSEVVVPYQAIPADVRLQIGTRLHQRLQRPPTRGEVENAYAQFLQGRQLQIGGGE